MNEQQVLHQEEREDMPRWMWNAGYALLEVMGIAGLVRRGARGGRMRAAEPAADEREREIA